MHRAVMMQVSVVRVCVCVVAVLRRLEDYYFNRSDAAVKMDRLDADSESSYGELSKSSLGDGSRASSTASEEPLGSGRPGTRVSSVSASAADDSPSPVMERDTTTRYGIKRILVRKDDGTVTHAEYNFFELEDGQRTYYEVVEDGIKIRKLRRPLRESEVLAEEELYDMFDEAFVLTRPPGSRLRFDANISAQRERSYMMQTNGEIKFLRVIKDKVILYNPSHEEKERVRKRAGPVQVGTKIGLRFFASEMASIDVSDSDSSCSDLQLSSDNDSPLFVDHAFLKGRSREFVKRMKDGGKQAVRRNLFQTIDGVMRYYELKNDGTLRFYKTPSLRVWEDSVDDDWNGPQEVHSDDDEFDESFLISLKIRVANSGVEKKRHYFQTADGEIRYFSVQNGEVQFFKASQQEAEYIKNKISCESHTDRSHDDEPASQRPVKRVIRTKKRAKGSSTQIGSKGRRVTQKPDILSSVESLLGADFQTEVIVVNLPASEVAEGNEDRSFFKHSIHFMKPSASSDLLQVVNHFFVTSDGVKRYTRIVDGRVRFYKKDSRSSVIHAKDQDMVKPDESFFITPTKYIIMCDGQPLERQYFQTRDGIVRYAKVFSDGSVSYYVASKGEADVVRQEIEARLHAQRLSPRGVASSSSIEINHLDSDHDSELYLDEAFVQNKKFVIRMRSGKRETVERAVFEAHDGVPRYVTVRNNAAKFYRQDDDEAELEDNFDETFVFEPKFRKLYRHGVPLERKYLGSANDSAIRYFKVSEHQVQFYRVSDNEEQYIRDEFDRFKEKRARKFSASTSAPTQVSDHTDSTNYYLLSDHDSDEYIDEPPPIIKMTTRRGSRRPSYKPGSHSAQPTTAMVQIGRDGVKRYVKVIDGKVNFFTKKDKPKPAKKTKKQRSTSDQVGQAQVDDEDLQPDDDDSVPDEEDLVADEDFTFSLPGKMFRSGKEVNRNYFYDKDGTLKYYKLVDGEIIFFRAPEDEALVVRQRRESRKLAQEQKQRMASLSASTTSSFYQSSHGLSSADRKFMETMREKEEIAEAERSKKLSAAAESAAAADAAAAAAAANAAAADAAYAAASGKRQSRTDEEKWGHLDPEERRKLADKKQRRRRKTQEGVWQSDSELESEEELTEEEERWIEEEKRLAETASRTEDESRRSEEEMGHAEEVSGEKKEQRLLRDAEKKTEKQLAVKERLKREKEQRRSREASARKSSKQDMSTDGEDETTEEKQQLDISDVMKEELERLEKQEREDERLLRKAREKYDEEDEAASKQRWEAVRRASEAKKQAEREEIERHSSIFDAAKQLLKEKKAKEERVRKESEQRKREEEKLAYDKKAEEIRRGREKEREERIARKLKKKQAQDDT